MALYVWGSNPNSELGLGGSDDDESYNSPQKLNWEEGDKLIQAALGDKV